MIINCKQCKTDFRVPKSRFRTKFCSKNCYSKSQVTRITTNCLCCNKEFSAFASRNYYGRGLHCSKECQYKMQSGEHNSKWKGGYENILFHIRKRRAVQLSASGSHTTDEWVKLKKKFNYMCLCCKQQEPFIKLTLDHIVPLSCGGSNDISNIQPLCRSCNSRKHAKIIDFRLNKNLCQITQ